MSIGDRVRVINGYSGMVGEIGTVIRVHEGCDVLLDSDNQEKVIDMAKFELYFDENELELL